MVTLYQDDFDRPNDAASPGSPQVGGPYAATNGTWGINNGELYLSNTSNPNHYLLLPGASDVDFSATVVTAVGSSAGVQGGLVVRAIDAQNAFYTARTTTGSFAIFRSVAGTGVQISPEFASAANDAYRFVCFGRYIWFYLNGRLAWHAEDMRYDPTVATRIGYRNGSTTTARWDNALAVDATASPTSWGAAPQGADGIDIDLPSDLQLVPSLYKGRDTAFADESEIP